MKKSIIPAKFGEYGGQYVPETLIPALHELEEVFLALREDPGFTSRLNNLLNTYAGRPTSLFYAARLTSALGGAKIYLKREDLTHTGAHKINNALGQALLATEINKTRLIAETGAGQHGVATATVAALLGLECEIYMGAVDMERQAPNVARMELLGAKVTRVESGSQTLKDAINEAIRDWVANSETSHYLLGSALGPHPYPTMVRDFQAVIGKEAREQILAAEGRLPDLVVACVGGGSNAIGIFSGFVQDAEVQLLGVEAGGQGISPGLHAARFADGGGGSPGVLHGCFTFVLQDEDGQINQTHSVSAGLDYAAIGPEHSQLRDLGRAKYTWVRDEAALEAFHLLSRTEGIIPALESAHAVAEATRLAPDMSSETVMIINLSGRGDKDLQTVLSANGSADMAAADLPGQMREGGTFD